MKNLNKIIWGCILVAVGALFALNALGITDIDIFFDGWWTLLIIIPCAVGLVTERAKFGNLIGMMAGVFMLLVCQDIVDFSLVWKLAFPVLLIAIGLKMIFGSVAGGQNREAIRKLRDGGDLHSRMAAFSGQTLDFSGETFEGMELTAVFGGIKLDLTRAVIDRDCLIDANAYFGGITVLVPPYVNVKVRSNSLFGGVTDKVKRNTAENPVTVYVDAACMFGGVDIK